MTSLPPLAVTRAASDARNATLRPVHLPCRPACVGSSGPTNPSWVPVGPKGLPRISFDCQPDQRAAPLRANRSIACAHAAFPLVLHTRNWERFERRTPGVLFSILSLRSNKLPFLMYTSHLNRDLHAYELDTGFQRVAAERRRRRLDWFSPLCRDAINNMQALGTPAARACDAHHASYAQAGPNNPFGPKVLRKHRVVAFRFVGCVELRNFVLAICHTIRNAAGCTWGSQVLVIVSCACLARVSSEGGGRRRRRRGV